MATIGAINSTKFDQASGFGSKSTGSSSKLSDKDQQTVNQLKSTDTKVRAHESAHMAAGGGLVRGGASFTYTTGPDGKRYATGGEVQIDMSEVPNNPQATVTKMQQVRRAALAPADPSSQDRMVAAEASNIESKARSEMLRQKNSTGMSAAGLKAVNSYTSSARAGVSGHSGSGFSIQA